MMRLSNPSTIPKHSLNIITPGFGLGTCQGRPPSPKGLCVTFKLPRKSMPKNTTSSFIFMCDVWLQWCGNLLRVVQKHSYFLLFMVVLCRVRLAYLSSLSLLCWLMCFILSSWKCMPSICILYDSRSRGVGDVFLVLDVSTWSIMYAT